MPKIGSRYIVKKWAWYPIVLDTANEKENATRIWFETYYSHQIYNWKYKPHIEYRLLYYDNKWLETGILSTTQERVKNRLGVE